MKEILQKKANRSRAAEDFERKRSILAAQPYDLTIETGAICPLRCLICEQTHNDFDLSREFLELDCFKQIIDYFCDSIEHINLFNWGEPLLNPSLCEMIKYAWLHNIHTAVHTSLNFLNSSLSEQILTSGLTELILSIDGASERTYQKYRKGGSFKNVFNNLRLLLSRQKQINSISPRIIWKFLVFRHNEHEIGAAKKLADDLGVEIKFSFAVTNNDLTPTLEEFNNSSFKEKFCKEYDLPCNQLWRGPVIHSNGDILPCCLVYQKKYVLGNMFNEDFTALWNNYQYQNMRKTVADKLHPDSSIYCTSCRFNPRLLSK